ncbi:MAG: hypothetical protein NWE91_00550 [Candidatus Bathyarchaeota archaeon]|nr:hypothetical protein [Candidatus Bathyarchaeota archaeon]
MLTEQEHTRKLLELNRKIRLAEHGMLRIVVVGLSMQQRKDVLDEWFRYHLCCVDGKGHRWGIQRWLPEPKAWLGGPCEKCGLFRLTQTTGNTIAWYLGEHSAEALVMNEDFGKLEHGLTELWRFQY